MSEIIFKEDIGNIIEENNYFLKLKWSGSSFVSSEASPENYVYETDGKIFVCDYEEINSRLIGGFNLEAIDTVKALNDKLQVSLVDCFDTSSELYMFYENICKISKDKTYDYHPPHFELVDFKKGTTFLAIHGFGLLPGYQGFGLGRKALNMIISRFSLGRALVGVHVLPLVPNINYLKNQEDIKFFNMFKPMTEDNCERKNATKKNKKFYIKAGFVPIFGSDFLYKTNISYG